MLFDIKSIFPLSLTALVLLIFPTCSQEKQLTVETSETGKTYLTYNNEPLLAFGPGDEMRILNGAADVKRWVDWQRKNDMNLIRAYPVSAPAEVFGTAGIAPFLKAGDKWDVDAFNESYFKHIGEVAKKLEENDIVLHLQLWQIVFFKYGDRFWDRNFLNPNNNANEWTTAFSRGRDYIDAPAGSIARDHQKRWVLHILDALKGRGNVIIDIINELGNTMGTMEWAVEVAEWVHEWEKENEWSFIVGVDSEHHYSPEQFGMYKDHFDIIILNELRSHEFAFGIINTFNMPAVSVRSSDGTNHPDDYLFARTDQTGPEHQTRYRTLCYRSIFAGLQSVGTYWKPEIQDADYKNMEYWPEYAKSLRIFWGILAPHWPLLMPDPSGNAVVGAVTPYAYRLASPTLIALYLECGSHSWNNEYPASTVQVSCLFEHKDVQYFNPRTGEATPISAARDGDSLVLSLPPFTDDAIILIAGQ